MNWRLIPGWALPSPSVHPHDPKRDKVVKKTRWDSIVRAHPKKWHLFYSVWFGHVYNSMLTFLRHLYAVKWCLRKVTKFCTNCNLDKLALCPSAAKFSIKEIVSVLHCSLEGDLEHIEQEQYQETMIKVRSKLWALPCRWWEIHRNLCKVWWKCRISLQIGNQTSTGCRDVQEHWRIH